jgi:neutral ceramidase
MNLLSRSATIAEAHAVLWGSISSSSNQGFEVVFTTLRLVVLFSFLFPSAVRAVERLELTSPRPHQVVQRIGLAPGQGYADILIVGNTPARLNQATMEYRVVAIADLQEKTSKTDHANNWSVITPVFRTATFHAAVRVPAGGWYRLECRFRVDDEVVAEGAVEPIGVGELFIVAGQSYATNCNDERLTVADPQQRVVAFDLAKRTWAAGHDPQPVFDGSDGGSIWPPLGDALVQELNVPIGFANVAIGGSASEQWLPEGKLHQRLIEAAKSLSEFRGVLWQQGESDVINKNSTDGYVANLSKIRDSFSKSYQATQNSVQQHVGDSSPSWLLAKSTHHPTVYNDPESEQRIRAGIDQLVKLQPAFLPGPDTDELKGEHRGDKASRRHFTGIGQRRAAEMWLTAIRQQLLNVASENEHGLRVGLAEADITPPVGFPMAGYYHERLAEGQIDPLKAKAIVFRDGETTGALVVCDLIGIATDLSREVRRRVSEKTGIPASHIVVAATHSHTAPDYMKELWLYLGKEKQEALRSAYIEKLIGGPVEAIVRAYEEAGKYTLETGVALQHEPVAFNRRFVMRDGSVQTWQALSNPEVVRAAGPIDPRIELLAVRNSEDGRLRGLLSNFALHLDTVSGMRWSADYPYFIEQMLRKNYGEEVISIFGTGCCGDINHVDPSSTKRNKADTIGNSLGTTICQQFAQLSPLMGTRLRVKSQVVELPLLQVTEQEVKRALELIGAVKQGVKVEFFDHVTSYKQLILDQFLHSQPYAQTSQHITWGLSRALAGIGPTLPVEVTTMTIGDDVAIVCLPGEVFVELGLAIKQASPFRTTIVVELTNAVETLYVPHRAAYAGGSYEVTNSALKPGGGEILVEAALGLLRQSAAQNQR